MNTDCKSDFSTTTRTNIDMVIKFGGSAITDKSKLETLNQQTLQQAARLVGQCVRTGLKCVVIHGAGSFGHHHAKQYGVQNGWKCVDTDRSPMSMCGDTVRNGFCLTKLSVSKLLQHVVEALVNEGLPAVGIPCTGRWETENRCVVQHDVDTVRRVLHSGFIPVLHGDCVLDRTLGCAILSGDTIIETFCHENDVRCVVFLTSVDGVFNTSPESNTGAVLFKRILINSEGEISKCICGSTVSAELKKMADTVNTDDMMVSSKDVTGGMSKKLQSAINVVRNSSGRTKVHICKIGSHYASEICLHGESEMLGSLDGTVLEMLS